MIENILKYYGLAIEDCAVKAFGSGLINHTWLIAAREKSYILQRINHNVFKQPKLIDENLNALGHYLSKHYPAYLFTLPVETVEHNTLIQYDEDYYRLFEFVKDSTTYDVVEYPELAYEAARQFAKFTKLLAHFPATELKITLPDFHNLSLRYKQFRQAIENASKERLEKSKALIAALKSHVNIVYSYEELLQNPAFKVRVTHHDTKISNVLFNKQNKGICVIDLDTVMPGYFISDVGDMMRTYLSAAGEEETDLSKVFVRDAYFEAIVKGYLDEMSSELSADEIKMFVYAGKFMVYMQALRFLTDYLNNDIYYGAKYDLHNFNRAANQLTLLESLLSKEQTLQKKVYELMGKQPVG